MLVAAILLPEIEKKVCPLRTKSKPVSPYHDA